MTTTLTSTETTDTARARAIEATGTDPGAFVRRLHRDNCDRIRPADNPATHVEQHVAEYAERILAATVCTRCKPRPSEIEALREQAAEHADGPTPDVAKGPKAALDRVLAHREDAIAAAAATPDTNPVPRARRNARQPGGTGLTAAQVPHTADGRVAAVTPSVYPEVLDDVDLVCATDGATLPARRFAYMVKKGSGDGRMVECRADFEARLQRNKIARANGQPTEKAPHIDAEHVAPRL